MIDLIYCAGGNPRLSRLAADIGWYLGVRSGKSTDGYPIHFVDIDYQHPNFEQHLAIVGRLQPHYATVPDLSEKQVQAYDIDRAVRQAQQLSNYCEVVLLVPKLPGQIALLPERLAIGYSVPTSYGGAQYPLWELTGRRVHILGGSPHRQMEVYRYVQAIGTILSVDSNMAMKLATRHARYWDGGKWVKHPFVGRGARDLYLDCMHRSLCNIRQAWLSLQTREVQA
jgi:hypothetical protein